MWDNRVANSPFFFCSAEERDRTKLQMEHAGKHQEKREEVRAEMRDFIITPVRVEDRGRILIRGEAQECSAHDGYGKFLGTFGRRMI